MKKGLFTKQERRNRARIYYQIWQKNKAEFTMSQLTRLLGIKLSNFYNIVKRKEKENE